MNEEEPEEAEIKKRGRNSFMEGNVPQNINEDLDKSIFIYLFN